MAEVPDDLLASLRILRGLLGMSLPADLPAGELLSEEQVEEIRRELEGGTHGPIVTKWARLLLADRAERRRRDQLRNADVLSD